MRLLGLLDDARTAIAEAWLRLNGRCVWCFGRGVRAVVDPSSRSIYGVHCPFCSGTGRAPKC